MTLIYGYKIPSDRLELGTGVIVAGDTILTSRHIDEINLYQALGKTSQNQNLSPLTNSEDYVSYFTESACKIGRLNENVLISTCGSVELIYLLLQQFFLTPDRFKTCEGFSTTSLEGIFNSIQPIQNLEILTTAEILFCIFDSGSVTFIDLRCIVDETNTLKHVVDFFSPSSHHPAWVKGSHHEKFVAFSRSLHENWKNLYFIGAIQQAHALEISNLISDVTRNDARSGIGGAILTYLIDQNGISPPQDTIYLHASRNDELHALFKVSYRDGYFYVVDYIQNRLIGFAPLEKQIQGIECKSQEYIDHIVKDVTEFNAKWLFLKREIPAQDKENDTKFEIIIKGNRGEPIFPGDTLRLIEKNLKKGRLHLSFNEGTNQKREFLFTIRS